MPLDVNGYCWKPQRPIRMVLEEGHGYEICLGICTDSHRPVPGQLGLGLQMIRTPQVFHDIFHEVTERRLLKSLYKGHFCSYNFCILMRIHKFWNSLYCICLRIYFAGTFSQNL